MAHEPFIWASYAVAAVVLAWCALAPVIRGRRLARALLRRHTSGESEHASQA